MNTPNKLTLLRVVLVPVYMLFLMWDGLAHRFLIGGLIFGVAAITDLFDGKLARKNNQVTDFGKFMDPIADKLLICGAFCALVQMGLCSAWILFIVLFREFIVSSLRMIAAAKGGKVIAANMWGKVKTVTQIVALSVIFLMQELLYLHWLPVWFPADLLGSILLWISAAVTLISGGIYLWDNKKYIF